MAPRWQTFFGILAGIFLAATPVPGMASGETTGRKAGDTGSTEKNEFPRWLLPLRLEGSLEEEITYRVSSPDRLSKFRSLVKLRGNREFSRGASLTFSLRAFHDAVFGLRGGYSEEARDSLEWEFLFRDFYLDLDYGDLALRLGKQQVVWGAAFGRFVADIVNPKDLREFLLPDLEFIRRSLWLAEMTLTRGRTQFEFVWIPDLEFDRLSPEGAEYSFFSQVFPPGTLVERRPPIRPARTLGNSEIGARVSTFGKGWDLSLFYFSGHTDLPVPFRRITSGPMGTTVILEPEHRRVSTAGVTFSGGWRRVVFRGESIFSPGMFLPTEDPLSGRGVLKEDRLSYVLGVDWSLPRQFLLSGQVFQDVALGNRSELAMGQADTTWSMRLARESLEARWLPSLEYYHGVEGGSLSRFRISRTGGDSTLWSILLDSFSGPEDSFYGQFRNRDRIGIEWSYFFSRRWGKKEGTISSER